MSLQKKIILVSLPVLAAIIVCVNGCGHYGKVNELTFEHAKALYSVCNRHDTQRLKMCARMIEEAASSEQMSRTEASYLNDIIAAARSNKWKDAQAMVRQLMFDQIEP